MTTEFIQEKINTINQMILQEDLQLFQQQMALEVSQMDLGDSSKNAQLREQGEITKTHIAVHEKKLEIYRAKKAVLEAELAHG